MSANDAAAGPPAATPTPQPPATPQRPAVALLNFGGPRNLEEVETFVFEILRDPNTIQLPAPTRVQDALARRIAASRAPEVRHQYGEIGGRSPLVAATDAIAKAMGDALAERGATGADGGPLPVYVLHRYLPGHAREAVARLKADGVDALFAVPLYPHFSYATTGSSFEQLRDELRDQGWAGPVHCLRSYPDAAGYLDALGDRLQATLDAAGVAPADTVVLCSAHGLPLSYVQRGDPYRIELYRTLQALRQRFPAWRFDLSFQSRVGPAEWLRPYTDEYIGELAAEGGVRHVVFLPLAFVNDHIETLYEIGVTYFGQCREHGLAPHRVPAVEDHPGHIAVLADAVAAWHAGRGALPLADEVLPPSQAWARRGRWAWGAWLVALFATLLFALC